MASTYTSKLEREITTLEDRLHSLRKTRNEKFADLLTARARKQVGASQTDNNNNSSSKANSKAKKKLGEYQIDDRNASDILLAQSASLAEDSNKWQLESLYRMTGLTAFKVKDPSPGGGELLGIRIEIFVNASFKTPYYLIFAPFDLYNNNSKTASDGDTGSSTITSTILSDKDILQNHYVPHRHTLPAFVLPLFESLCEKHLPPPPTPQSLDLVASALRRVLLLFHTRLFYLEQVEKEVTTPPGMDNDDGIRVSKFDIDVIARQVLIEWTAEEEEERTEEAITREAVISISEEGSIEKVVVKEGGSRVKVMEQQISRRLDSWRPGKEEDKYTMDIKTLAERLVWAAPPPRTTEVEDDE